MSILNVFRRINIEKDQLKDNLKNITERFKEIEKENLILLEEIRMLKKLLYGIEWDKVEKEIKKK